MVVKIKGKKNAANMLLSRWNASGIVQQATRGLWEKTNDKGNELTK